MDGTSGETEGTRQDGLDWDTGKEEGLKSTRDLKAVGKEFLKWGAATEKAWVWKAVLSLGTVRKLLIEERSVLDGLYGTRREER